MKIDDLLNDSWKDFLNKNSKWLVGILIRYASLIGMGMLLFLFLFLNYFQARCDSNNNNDIIVIKQGKITNITKVGKETNDMDVKEIDLLIKDLQALKEKNKDK